MRRTISACSAVALLSGAALGQPVNDFCNSPATISGTGTFFFSTIFASTDGPSLPACGAGTAFNDVWFCWTANATGRFSFSTCGSTSLDTVLAVYPLCGCPSLSQAPLVCNDDACGTQSRAELDATAGTSYFVRVGTYAETQSGSGNLTIAAVGANSGTDVCLTAFPVGLDVPVGFTLTNATSENPGSLPVPCSAAGMFNDVWYTFTPDAPGAYRVSTCNQTAVDTILAVYAGPLCPTGTALPLACDDDSCGGQSSLVFGALPDRPYFIRLGGYSATTRGGGTFTLTSAVLSGAITDPETARQYVLLDAMSWDEANAAAATLGGNLVSIGSAAENTFVRTNVLRLGNIDRLGWLGINDSASPGVFAWSSGEPVTFANWGAGQPRVSGTENFGVMDSRTGQWVARVSRPALDRVYGIVELGGPTIPACRADISGSGGPPGDGVVDGSDYIAFFNSFALGNPGVDPAADVSGPGGVPGPDGVIDGDDYIAFFNAFAAGC